MCDAKAETLVDGVANFKPAFIYSEHEITPLKLFAAVESVWFCALLEALGVLWNDGS